MANQMASKKEREYEDYKLIKTLLTQYKTDDGVRAELNKVRDRVEQNIRFLVSEKEKNQPMQSSVNIGKYSANEYLDFMHEILENFHDFEDKDFHIEYLKEALCWNDFEEFSQPSVYANRNKAYTQVSDDLPTLLRLMQSLRLLKNQELNEVLKLYEDLLES
jgi:hypothetical protein